MEDFPSRWSLFVCSQQDLLTSWSIRLICKYFSCVLVTSDRSRLLTLHSYQDYQLQSPIQTTLRFIPLGVVGSKAPMNCVSKPTLTLHSLYHILFRISSLPRQGKLHLNFRSRLSRRRKPPVRRSHSAVNELFCIWISRHVFGSFRSRYRLSVYRPIYDTVIAEKRPGSGRSDVSNCGLDRPSHVSTCHSCHSSFYPVERPSRWRRSKTGALRRVQRCRVVLLRMHGCEPRHDSIRTAKYWEDWTFEETWARAVRFEGES
jgi:hypothetical protein